MSTAVEKEVNPHFEDFLFDWRHQLQLLVGGYGSSKSYNAALKIILKLLEEKRKALVVREVYDTHRDSTFSLFQELIEDLGLSHVIKTNESPMRIRFPNGSRIIFRGMDKPEKVKSINNVTIVWIEECSEVKYAGFKELLFRLRHPTLPLYTLLSTNPVSEDNWVYTHFFEDAENERVILKAEELYEERIVVKDGTYYHHSVESDNLFLQQAYRDRLDELKEYDPDLHRIAKEGKFGVNGKLVLPQLVEWEHKDVMAAINSMRKPLYKNGMDFGFVESSNAVSRMCIDTEKEWLYIWDEYYTKGITDDQIASDLEKKGLKKVVIKGDNAEAKTIFYLQQKGFRILSCYKLTRVENTKKVKRFKKIIVSKDCRNHIRELKNLTFKINPKTGKAFEDEFNIDPHTLSAIWYGLDDYEVASVKGYNAKRK